MRVLEMAQASTLGDTVVSWIPGLVVALFAFLGPIIVRRMQDSATRQPTMKDLWDRLDKQDIRIGKLEKALNVERRARESLKTVFLRYVRRVQTGGSNELTAEEAHALEDEDNQQMSESSPV